MWSIDYIAKAVEDEAKSLEADSEDRPPSSLDVEKINEESLPTQDSEEIKSESEIQSEDQVKTEDIEPREREAAIKRVEELVKQMSLSQENGGNYLFKFKCLIYTYIIIYNRLLLVDTFYILFNV